MKSLENIISSTKRILGTSLLVGAIAVSPFLGGCGKSDNQQTNNNPAKIVFNSDTQGNGNTDIYVMDADGKNRKKLTSNPNLDSFPSLSKYGKIAFTSGRGENPGIYTMDLDGSNLRRLSSNSNADLMPSWSLDGKKIVFYSARDGNLEIYSMNADGSKQSRLTFNPSSDVRPTWSPNGTRIFFDSDRDGNAEIYIMNADGSEQRRLTYNPAVDTDPSCSLDGRVAFSSDRDGNPQIYVMDLSGKNIKKLTQGPSINAYPTWSPDGNQIFFVSTRDGNPQIYSMNANGNNQRRLTTSRFDDCDPSFCVLDVDQQKNDRAESLDKIVGNFQDVEIGCIVGSPDASLVALYTLKTKNTYGKTLHETNADLYLLDDSNNNHAILTYLIGNVKPNSEIEAMWKLEARSKIGADWQSRQKMYFNVNERAHYGNSPSLLVFIRSKEGVFEVNSSKFTLYFPVDKENYQATSVSLMSGSLYSVFEKAGVQLPKR